MTYDPKPADCTCQYPKVVNRNVTGHAFDCPAHKRLISAYSPTATVKKYRKLPVVIEAVEWNGYNFAAVAALSDNIFGPYSDDHIEIATLEGRMKAQVDDWIIKGVHGEVYPCKPDIFEKTYEAVTE